jgi:hypothetical protein
MTDWIKWNGGECPIKSEKTRGQWKHSTGFESIAFLMKSMKWPATVSGHNVIAYRITENHEPPYYAPIDMSQNRVPWGLLTDAERGALDAWVMSGKPVEIFAAGEWCSMQLPRILTPGNAAIYRTVAPPVITEECQDISTNAGHLVTVTLTLQDGKPISGTVAV